MRHKTPGFVGAARNMHFPQSHFEPLTNLSTTGNAFNKGLFSPVADSRQAASFSVNDDIAAKQRYDRIVSQSRARRQASVLEPENRFVFTSSVVSRKTNDEEQKQRNL